MLLDESGLLLLLPLLLFPPLPGPRPFSGVEEVRSEALLIGGEGEEVVDDLERDVEMGRDGRSVFERLKVGLRLRIRFSPREAVDPPRNGVEVEGRLKVAWLSGNWLLSVDFFFL